MTDLPARGQTRSLRYLPERRDDEISAVFEGSTNLSQRWLHLIEALFVGFLLLVLVRLQTGAADSTAARANIAAAVGEGDSLKQISYLVFFGLFLFMYFIVLGARRLKCVSVYQYLVLAWIFVSCSWALAPAISFRRAILLCIVFMSLAIAIETLGIRRTIRAIYTTMAIIVVASLLSVGLSKATSAQLFKFAIHPGDEADPSIIGAWRGVMIHKNTAGGVSGMAVIVFFHYAINRRKWYDWAILLLAVAFLIGTKSKTSAGFLLPVIFAGLTFRTLWRGPRGRILWTFSFVTILACSVLLGWALEDRIQAVFNNPMAFTGRTTIWKVALAEIGSHPFFGAGYSSFWAAGRTSDLYHLMTNPFLEFILHSHNGFLEVAVSSGLIGLGLALVASVIVPLSQGFKWNGLDIELRSLLISMLLFGICENILETQLYTKDREIWIMLCASVLLLQQLTTMRSRQKAIQRRSGPIATSEYQLAS